MSNITHFEQMKSLVNGQATSFETMAKIHGAVHFQREASFALEALQNNSFLLSTAVENPDSLKRAILNVAAIGLTLSPVYKFAYLVPRDKKVMLDLSYKGMVQIFIEAKAIKYCQADLVFAKDKFVLRGRGQEPIHERNPFDSDRGELVGAYCIVETFGGDFLVETMTAKEIFSIRDRSVAYKSFKDGKARSCPWVTDESEMVKKTIIRRASKSWPLVDTREDSRFAKAISVHDEASEIDLSAPPLIEAPKKDTAKIDEIKNLLVLLEKSEEKFIGYLSGVNKRDIKSIEDMTDYETDQALIQLKQWAKPKVEENKNENT